MPRFVPPVLAGMLMLTCARAPAGEPAADMAGAATAWVDSLTAAQRPQAVFPIQNTERENWHYVPRSRKGISLQAMNPEQREAARRLLAVALSTRGMLEVEAIIALENILAEAEGSSRRNPALYYFTVFGAPDPASPWGWRVEGHHLSINFTLAAGRCAVTPLFFGANPAEARAVRARPGRRPLAAEEDQGRALVLSFDEAQRRTAVLTIRAPADVITGADRSANPITPAGLPWTEMNPTQHERLRTLVEIYAGRLRPELAAAEMEKISAAGWNRVHFAWAGSVERGEGHYYRIQGPDFLIEYDNTQDGANHIHTTWRRFQGDFGRDLLREHYQREHTPSR